MSERKPYLSAGEAVLFVLLPFLVGALGSYLTSGLLASLVWVVSVTTATWVIGQAGLARSPEWYC